ncbi:PREDICTED: protein FAM71E2 [Condylura cristata]|uniref:protein FAM71E2 n=1 Tax=Condylura cristata TaxID=143302 RepID=UPI000642C6BE|nr:PREDICTED: protein FAM71E2 [Condylura cristata]
MNRLWNIRRMDPLRGSPKWVPTLGELQKTLQKGEYLPLRPLPMFESNFVQVTNRGSPVYVHHGANRLTMGVAASLPGLVLPDMLLIARPPEGRDGPNVVLTRMIPLDLAQLYVHDLTAWRLKLRLVTGHYYYLELDAPDSEVAFLFNRWIRLINLLQEPSTTWVPRAAHTPSLGLASATAPASTWRLQGPPHSQRSVMIAQPTFPYAVLTPQKQKKAKTLKRRFKSQAVGDSMPLIWSKLEPAAAEEAPGEKTALAMPLPRKRASTDMRSSSTVLSASWARAATMPTTLPSSTATQKQEPAEDGASGRDGSPAPRRDTGGPSRPEKPSITIRTIFSIISNTVTSSQSSAKAATGRGPRGGALLEPTTGCVQPDSHSASLLGSYDHLDQRLWQQHIQDLMDPESSTLSSSSLGPAAPAPALYLATPGPFPRHEKGRPLESRQRVTRPPSQKGPQLPAASRKAPFLLDRSHKIPAVHAPFKKGSSGAPGKALGPPAAPQKALAAPPRKGPPALATAHGAPCTPAPARKARPASPKGPGRRARSQKAPPVPAVSPKAVSPPVLHRKPPFRPAPPQRAAGPAATCPVAWDPAGRGLLPRGAVGEPPEPHPPEAKPGPVALVGTREEEVVEVRAEQTSLQLPDGTTKVDSVKVVVSRAHELSLGGWKSKGKLEDVTITKKEETVLDMPGFKAKRLGQQHKWVKTQELALDGAAQEHSRPFSVEGLALAKLMIMANCTEPPLRPPVVGLPSWLSIPQASSLAVKDPQPSVAAEGPARSASRKPTFQAPPAKLASSGPKKTGISEAPIPLPALRWEDTVSPAPSSPNPIPQMEMRMSPQHKGGPPDLEGAQKQRPLATVGSASEILLPSLLDITGTNQEGLDTGLLLPRY